MTVHFYCVVRISLHSIQLTEICQKWIWALHKKGFIQLAIRLLEMSKPDTNITLYFSGTNHLSRRIIRLVTTRWVTSIVSLCINTSKQTDDPFIKLYKSIKIHYYVWKQKRITINALRLFTRAKNCSQVFFIFGILNKVMFNLCYLFQLFALYPLCYKHFCFVFLY